MKRLAITLILAVSGVLVPAHAADDTKDGQLRLVRETLFAAGWQGGGVYRFDPRTGEVVEKRKTTLYNNNFLAWSESRRELYVAADNGGTIAVLATGPLRQVAAIRDGVGWNAGSIAVSPDGTLLYATFMTWTKKPGGPANCRLAVYDLATRRLARSLVLAEVRESAALALSPDGAEIYVSREGAVEVYDAASLTLLRRTETEKPANRVVVASPDGAAVYMASSVASRGTAVRRNIDTLTATDREITPAFTLTVSRDGARVWVASGREIVECDAMLEPIRRLTLPSGAIDIEESLDRSQLYVLILPTVGGKRQAAAVCVVELATGKVVRQFDAPSDVRDLLVVAT
jgi:DNA-binding beta-propeller fold protein YncE